MKKELQRTLTQPLYSLPLHFLKSNIINGEILNCQAGTKQTKSRPNKKTAESAEKISTMKQNQNIHNDIPSFRLLKFRDSRFGCPSNARVISAGELGTMSKNNLIGIVLAIAWTYMGDSLSYLAHVSKRTFQLSSCVLFLICKIVFWFIFVYLTN